MKAKYTVREVVEMKPWSEEFVRRCIESQWIEVSNPASNQLDEEDLARLQLIQELRENLGVNDEAIPLVLHLIDQLNYVHGCIEDLRQKL